MSEYRIKKNLNDYTVQKKGLFGWYNCLKEPTYPSSDNYMPKTFTNWHVARAAIEKLIERDKFKPRYYYPPISYEEPKNG